MTTSCPDLTRLAEAETLPAGHPLRAHLQACGRCRATLRALAAFRAGDGPADLPDRDRDDADRRLAAFIERELSAPAAAQPAAPHRARPVPGGTRGWLAAAAVLVVAAGLWIVRPGPDGRPADGGGPLRGAVPPSAVTVVADGAAGVLATWPVVAGAEDYEIVLWTAALAEFARLEARPGTSRHVVWDATADPPPAYLTVVARQGGREIGRTGLVKLP